MNEINRTGTQVPPDLFESNVTPIGVRPFWFDTIGRVPGRGNDGPHAFSIRVPDDTMRAVVSPDEYVLVDPDMKPDLENGSFVVAKLGKTNELVLRWLVEVQYRRTRLYLRSCPEPSDSRLGSITQFLKKYDKVIGVVYGRVHSKDFRHHCGPGIPVVNATDPSVLLDLLKRRVRGEREMAAFMSKYASSLERVGGDVVPPPAVSGLT